MKKSHTFFLIFFCIPLFLSATGCGNVVSINEYLLQRNKETPVFFDFEQLPDLSLSFDRLTELLPQKKNFDFDESITPLYQNCSYYLPYLSKERSDNFLALYQGIMNFSPMISLPHSISSEEAEILMALITNDCPELFQIDSSWTQHSTLLGSVSAISPNYLLDQDTYHTQRYAVEALLQNFHVQLAGYTPYQIELALYQYIINSCVYSLDAAGCQTAYGALIGGAAKCDGRAKALVWALRSFNIISSVITGSNHAWVIVRLDGVDYNVDPTYDDMENNGIQAPITYAHFNVPQTAIASDPYPADSVYQSLAYPSTTHWASNYHIKSNLWIAAGADCYPLFLAQVKAAAQAGHGTINLRFESEQDLANALSHSNAWIQDYLNQSGQSCSIKTYDLSNDHILFIELSF